VTGGLTKGGWGALIAAKAVCCGVLLLFLTGVLTLNGVQGWLRDGNPAWLALAGAGGVAGVFLWLRRQRRDGSTTERHQRLETKGTP
jgi:hypothetical protein